jgi:hypothetical protein
MFWIPKYTRASGRIPSPLPPGGHILQFSEQEIHEITQIPIRALRNYDLREFRVDERMRLVTGRKTRVEEDRAYCLLGIFGVFLPLIYGEGEEHALGRLKVEIQRHSGSLQSSYVADTQTIPGMFLLPLYIQCWLEFSSRYTASKLLPFSRNKFFVGRENYLRTPQEQLRPTNTHRDNDTPASPLCYAGLPLT